MPLQLNKFIIESQPRKALNRKEFPLPHPNQVGMYFYMYSCSLSEPYEAFASGRKG